MEFHQLRYVCAVAETGSFSRAAERCQVAQPSLSQQILKLEEDLGARLFDRLGRSIRLTEAGRAFLPHARSVLEQMEAARYSVTAQHMDVRGRVTVGVIPTIAPYFMPVYTARFTAKFPEAKLRIIEETTPVLVEGLRDLSIDLAILALPLRHKDLEVVPLRAEPVFAVLPKEHPLAGSESLSLKELRGEPFVMLRDGHCFRDLSIAACSSARITPNIAFESGQFSSVLAMVGAGFGISMVPEMAVDRAAHCCYVRLNDARARRTIVLAMLRGRSFNRVQQAFAALITSGVTSREEVQMKPLATLFLLGCSSALAYAAPITPDVSAVKSGPISVAASAQSLTIAWEDSTNQHWQTIFSLDSTKPLITAISVDGRNIVELAKPYYRCSTGKRRGGWDAFFDFPPDAPQGTRQFLFEFHPATVTARTVGNRVEVTFDGVRLGIFTGSLRYTFYPGTPLMQQAALVSTHEPDTAFYYDAGLEMTAEQDRRTGLNMESHISYYDVEGKLKQITPPYGSERHSLTAHYRTLAAKMGAGSIAVFPPPHRYFFARDYTTNQGYLWYSSWRGRVGLGVQQYPDDDTTIDPWMNAPPDSVQEMGLFLLPSAKDASAALKDVLAYTHNDHFVHLDGFVTFAPHWHLAYTVQAMEKGLNWEPPFKPMMKAIGIDSAMIMDFHGDGHPADLTNLRFHELDEYYKACRAQSDRNFLLIPSEEADIYLGGHWGLVFPHPVYWQQDRKPGQSFATADDKYGKVYRIHDAEDMWKMIKAEGGSAYQTHPRTKGSTGYPDKILNTAYFRDNSYLGTGWKAMPSDLSSPRLGERAFKTLDDLNNLGLHKHMIGEVDVFQISSADELYGHMNVNYLRLPELPSFDHYDRIMNSIEKGDGFITTGEILLPSISMIAEGDRSIRVKARVSSTFPLRIAEVVWGDGVNIHRQVIDLQSTPAFHDHEYAWLVDALGWKWARFAVWDVAGDGAFTNPMWRDRI